MTTPDTESPTIHLIKAWDEIPADEAPFCGATGPAPSLLRTTIITAATCEKCLAIAKAAAPK